LIPILLGCFLATISSAQAPVIARADESKSAGDVDVVPIWPGPAPGSESWTQKESESAIPGTQIKIIQNVTRPTLTVFLPDPATSTGTAVIICPGGAFHFLTIDDEGTRVAKWLAARGVAAFVLKYRLTPTGDDLFKQIQALIADRSIYDRIVKQLDPMITADGQQAVRVVRRNARKWNVSPDRIGLLGFSAGGYVVIREATNHDAESAPNFLGAIYPAVPSDLTVPSDAPPLFELGADDDLLVPPAKNEIPLYTEWKRAGKAAELHIFSKGGHGFGIRKQNLPVDGWLELFGEWLGVQGLLKPALAPGPDSAK
jgi:acetyl esterase/lipase